MVFCSRMKHQQSQEVNQKIETKEHQPLKRFQVRFLSQEKCSPDSIVEHISLFHQKTSLTGLGTGK